MRVGDIEAFNRALSTHSAVFTQDRTLSLVHRLRHNVIKTALRTLSLAYSRISLGDVRAKLALDSEEDAEYIVAKAIRDGVVQARIDHDRGEMTSREGGDVYSTGEPVREFDRRIGFLLDLYNQSVKVRRPPSLSSLTPCRRLTDLCPPRARAVDALPAQRPLEGARVGGRGARARARTRASPQTFSAPPRQQPPESDPVSVCAATPARARSLARRPRRSKRATRTPTSTGRATWTRSERGSRACEARLCR